MVRIFICIGYTRRQLKNPIRGFQTVFQAALLLRFRPISRVGTRCPRVPSPEGRLKPHGYTPALPHERQPETQNGFSGRLVTLDHAWAASAHPTLGMVRILTCAGYIRKAA